jgi:formate dehydrogenase major subunit
VHRLLALRARLREVQGTFALTVAGRGFDSQITPAARGLPRLRVRLLRRLRPGLPDRALNREVGRSPRHAHALGRHHLRLLRRRLLLQGRGAGQGDDTRVVRMVPWKDGGANEGHSCVKGRFAYGYAAHKRPHLKPMVRDSIDDPWQVVSWDEAIEPVRRPASRRIQAEHGKDAIGGISSSRCTNEEVYVVQKMVRAAFGNNNVDTCARVCHSPTGYGLKTTFGTSAGTQDFDSVEQADVILVIGANPTDAHPVFARA